MLRISLVTADLLICVLVICLWQSAGRPPGAGLVLLTLGALTWGAWLSCLALARGRADSGAAKKTLARP